MSNKILDDMRDVMRRRHYSVRTDAERLQCVPTQIVGTRRNDEIGV